MKLPAKIRRDWHFYAFAIGLIFILNGVVGLLGFGSEGLANLCGRAGDLGDQFLAGGVYHSPSPGRSDGKRRGLTLTET
ncbi:Protein of uncharacterised function (DUF2754) [Leclercia adecarboxylata]|uniref:Protein of uncharacterized function (DUF2754) n=1 Tax=Leclercia adecarboxylata TaxID=83655 RepID=A0A4U9HM78_9ENTR|nr:Protein of uncharacterised function (DUF2754) [Leclercia adecarboxylata]